MTRLLTLLLFVLGCADLSLSQGFWGSFKMNCGVSVWSTWGPTINGFRTRTRQIFRYPQRGGDPCPCLSETDKDPWTNRTVHERAAAIDGSFIRAINPALGPQATIRPRDTLFIVDMSGSIGESDFQVAKDKISELIGKICGTIGLQGQNNRAAVITFSRDVTENFDFDDHDNLASLQAAVRDMPFEGKGTCTGDALDLAKTMFSPSKGARPDVISVKEVVVLTDGKSNCGTDATTAARALQNSRNPPVSMFVFAISDFDADGRREIESMSSHPASVHLFTFVSVTEFEDVVNVILTYPNNCAPVVIAP